MRVRFESGLLHPVSQGNHTDTTVPVTPGSSQPAVLHTSVEQSAKVSRRRATSGESVGRISRKV